MPAIVARRAGAGTATDASGTPGSSRSGRRVALDRDAVERAFRTMRVADHRVLRAAVVPHHQVADRPPMAVRVLRARNLLVEVEQEGGALHLRPTVEAGYVVAVHV